MSVIRSRFRPLAWLPPFLALAFLLLTAQPVAAFAPPAGTPWWLHKTQLATKCTIEVGLAPIQPSYQQGDLAQLKLTTKRLDAGSGKIKIVITSADANTFDQPSIDPGSLNVFVDQYDAATRNYTLTSTNTVTAGSSANATLNYPLKTTAPTGETRLNFSAQSLDQNGTPTADCTVNGGVVIAPVKIIVNPSQKFDFAVNLVATPNLINAGDNFTVTVTVQNASTAQGSVPNQTPFRVTLKSLNTSSTNVKSTPVYTSFTNDTYAWDQSTTSSLNPGDSYPGSWQMLQKNNTASPNNKETFQACVTPLNQAGIDAELQNGQPTANNCTTVTVYLNSLKVTKTWADGSVQNKTFQPGDKADFTVTITNTSASVVGAPILKDAFQQSADCNSFASSCKAWDGSMSWINLPANVSEQPDHTLNFNIATLAAGQTLSYHLQAQVNDRASLEPKISPDADQARCNAAASSVTDGPLMSNARVCWIYEPTTLSTTKVFKLDNGQTATAQNIKAGGIGTYKIDIKNTGQNPAFGADFYDRQTQGVNTNLIHWVRSSITDPSVVVGDADHTLTHFSNTRIEPGQTVSLEPQFTVPCDALTNLSAAEKAAAWVDNVAQSSAQNDLASPAVSGTVRATIQPGHYNLAMTAVSNVTNVVPGDATKDKAAIMVTLTNKGTVQNPVDVAVPLVTVFADVPSQFTVDPNSITAGGTYANGRITWIVPSVGIDSEVSNLKATLQVDPDAIQIGSAPTVALTAQSISVGANCGQTSTDLHIDIQGARITTVKSVFSPADATIDRSQPVTFELKVSNDTSVAITRKNGQELVVRDPLQPNFTYAGNASCVGDCASVAGPNNSNNELTWTIRNLDKNASVKLRFDAKVDPSVSITNCPQDISNSKATLSDPSKSADTQPFNVATAHVYPVSSCLKGNVFAHNSDTSGTGITVATDVLIDPNTVLSANGSIKCGGNQSCETAPFKFGNYSVEGQNSVGLNMKNVVARMYQNYLRIEPRAEKLTLTNNKIASGTFDLYGGKPASSFPEGKVWEVNGDLTLDASSGPIAFSGKGTIIVKGNLNVVGNTSGTGKITTVDGTSKSAVGFIVLPTVDAQKNITGGGNVNVKNTVAALAGVVIYAPGSVDGTLNSNATTGILSFEADAANSPALRPAEGLFLARQVKIDRKQAVFVYRADLNTPAGAPPGFTFASSPNDTQEGQ